MVKIISFLTVVVLAMGMLSACSQPLVGQAGAPTPVIDSVTVVPTDQPTMAVPTDLPVTVVTLDPTTDAGIIITLDNQGQTINMTVGQSFLLKLGDSYTWDIVVSDDAVISRVRNIAVVQGAQGIYDANQAGTATLTATGDPVCRQAQPACGAPSIQFVLTVVVKG